MSSCSEVLSHSKWCSAHACLELSIELRDSITRYVCIGAFYRFYVGLDFISKGLITCLQLRSPHSFCFDGHRVIAFVVHSHCLKITQKSLIYQFSKRKIVLIPSQLGHLTLDCIKNYLEKSHSLKKLAFTQFYRLGHYYQVTQLFTFNL